MLVCRSKQNAGDFRYSHVQKSGRWWNNQLADSIEPSSYKADYCSGHQEILSLLWEPKFHYRVIKRLLLDFILSQMNAVHILVLFLRDQFHYYIPIYDQVSQVTFLPFKDDKVSLNYLWLVNTKISDQNYYVHSEETEGFPDSVLMKLSLLLDVLLKGGQSQLIVSFKRLEDIQIHASLSLPRHKH
jgi:hypothetical protein